MFSKFGRVRPHEDMSGGLEKLEPDTRTRTPIHCVAQGSGSCFAVFSTQSVTPMRKFTPKSLRSHFREHALSTESAEAEAVGNDENARTRHGSTGDERIEITGRGQWDGGDVVGEGPEQVDLDGGKRTPG
jgi:hypothetical protein